LPGSNLNNGQIYLKEVFGVYIFVPDNFDLTKIGFTVEKKTIETEK
jgi:hypothetical protein